MSQQKTCFYCLCSYPSKDNEHVFPEGLGGERVMMNCVCPDCNNKFSKLENEVISKSPIAFFRLAESDPDALKKHVMKEVRTFRDDKELGTPLEIQVTNGLRDKILAQIILKDESLHIRYEVQQDFDILLEAVKVWRESNRACTIKEHGKS